MRIRKLQLASIAILTSAVASTSAHVAISSGPAPAGGRAIVTFSVGHGCEGADTIAIDVAIPSEITSVRGMPNTFGEADVILDDAGLPTNVVWSKDEVRDMDDQFYEMAIRIAVPDEPFTVLYLPVHQGCRDADGMEYSTDWAALPGDEPEEGEEEAPPAAQLVILPARHPGWNKFTVPHDLTDLGMFFSDAQIVWSGDAAYSPNPTTAEMIEDESDVETLTEVSEGSEIWVKY
jgi:hypothetical protein